MFFSSLILSIFVIIVICVIIRSFYFIREQNVNTEFDRKGIRVFCRGITFNTHTNNLHYAVHQNKIHTGILFGMKLYTELNNHDLLCGILRIRDMK